MIQIHAVNESDCKELSLKQLNVVCEDCNLCQYFECSLMKTAWRYNEGYTVDISCWEYPEINELMHIGT